VSRSSYHLLAAFQHLGSRLALLGRAADDHQLRPGGRGGDVIFVGDESMGTLMDFRYKRMFKAGNGQDGGKRNCFGKDGESVVIKVPVGTVIREAESGKIMADITKHREEKILIHGGKGGKGNQHFATPTRQAPRYAEPGRVAKEYDVILELKLIADVGLIGFPNVGKSTLLSMVTNANPKIANYHFTTLAPNLGVVEGRYGDSFVLADIPGLVEGASEGVGLGHAFLRHVERTKVFIHVVDAAGVEGDDPVENVRKINQELEAFLMAFKLKNHLFPDESARCFVPEEEEEISEMLLKAQKFAEDIDKSNPVRRIASADLSADPDALES